MRRALLSLAALLTFTASSFPSLWAQSSGANSSSAVAHPDLQPGGGSPPGGGGGGGPVTPTAGGSLTFGSAIPVGQNAGFLGGVQGRQGPAATSGFDPSGGYSVAYTSTNAFDNEGDYYVYYGTIYGSGQNFQQLNVTNGTAASGSNPALQLAAVAGVPTLFMALNVNQSAAANGGGYTSILSTNSPAAGAPWSYINNLGYNSTSNYPLASYSPALTASNQYLFLGARNNADNTLTLCRMDITVSNGATSCTNFPGSRPMNFNPALAYWNGVLYIGFEEYDNTHALRLFTSTDNGQTISENTNIAVNYEDTTSTQPSLVVLNNALYVGFRSNDSSQHFLYKYSTDGINFTSHYDNGVSIVSAPALVKGSGINAAYVQNFYGVSQNGGVLLTFRTAAIP